MNVLKVKDFLKQPLFNNPLSAGALRNQPCVCGSGKKIKHCHGVKRNVSKSECDDIFKLINNRFNQGNK